MTHPAPDILIILRAVRDRLDDAVMAALTATCAHDPAGEPVRETMPPGLARLVEPLEQVLDALDEIIHPAFPSSMARTS